MKQEEAKSLFTLAGFEVKGMYELVNQYWPRTPDYLQIRADNPWWMVNTEFGFITIGWRKRVIEISWYATKLSFVVTNDEVTKDDGLVHAWSMPKALEYLTALRNEMVRRKEQPNTLVLPTKDGNVVVDLPDRPAYRPEHADRGWQPK